MFVRSRIHAFANLNFNYQLLIASLLRVLFTVYGLYQDSLSTVAYTDVDYKVFTDASRHILNGKSPYERHTFRYTPLLALLLTPNLLIHHTFGKILFCLFDILVAVLIRKIAVNTFLDYDYMKRAEVSDIDIIPKNKLMLKTSYIMTKANFCALLWLYNPMTITISTRGNCDSVSTFLVLLTLYYLQNRKMIFVAGFMHGISVYMRLYPIIYSLSFYIFLSNLSLYSISYPNVNKNYRSTSITTYLPYILPNFHQLKLIIGFALSLFGLIGISYYLYGYTFLYETYLYHLIRNDIRHNFSLYFYLQYLASSIKYQSLWFTILKVLPQLVLLLTFSIKYTLNRFCLNFSILIQTIVFVISNGVLTSQYFVWIMGILPLCVFNIRMPRKTLGTLLVAWIVTQVMWLLPAYYLEFRGKNMFFFIWIQCVSFYCVNIAILGRLIKHFSIN